MIHDRHVSQHEPSCLTFMFLIRVLRNALLVLLPLSLTVTTYLYLYPIFDTSCAFPAPAQDAKKAHRNTWRQHIPFSSVDSHTVAPFRLLSLGDPQLEGDTSIPDPQATSFPNFAKFWNDALLLGGTQHSTLQRLRHSLHDLIDFYLDDIPKAFQVYRKRLDHVGNDYYLGHIYRTLHWWSIPTHVTVLGDLVGSQWIDNQEFERRGWRYWNRVFKGGEKVPDSVTGAPSSEFNATFRIGHDAEIWRRRIINVAGNHDVGYAGDLSSSRIERFEKVFGKVNYELRFQLPIPDPSASLEHDGNNEERPVPELRIIVLNDMNMDAPAGSTELQAETYEFVNEIINTSKDVERQAHFTLVLTHIPLHKEAGVCVDAPFFDYYDGDFSDGVKEQNHLSKSASEGFLQGIYGMSGNPHVQGQGLGRHGVILNGHDHEGCDTYHFINQSLPDDTTGPPEWQAMTWRDAVVSKINDQPGVPGLREITVRSMMGDFAGNAGFFSLWFDRDEWEWKFEFSNCRLGKQHFWWIVHVLDLITVCVMVVFATLSLAIKTRDLAVRKISMFLTQHVQESEPRIVDTPHTIKLTTSNGSLEVPANEKQSVRKRTSKQKLRLVENVSNGQTGPDRASQASK